MSTITLVLVLITCWNTFLHLKLYRESCKRRELAIAFRAHLVERRSLLTPELA